MNNYSNINLPTQISEKIGTNFNSIPISHGASGCLIYNLKNNEPTESNYYLKINTSSTEFSLDDEYQRLIWLDGKLSVPKVLTYFKEQNTEYLLLSEIKGKPSFEIETESDQLNVVKLLAKGLKNIHTLNITNCPFDQTLKKQVHMVRERIDNNQIDYDDLDEENKSKSIEELYKELESKMNFEEDLVFTHGDYCLPNIILQDNEISGFVDLGRAGISDRYQDLALCARSLIYNFSNSNLIPIFFEEYGIKTIDEDKLSFYRLLDEFF